MLRFDKLSYRGQVRRLRDLAIEALTHYPLGDFNLQFIKHAENTTFRVIEKNASDSQSDCFLPGHYLLRIHRPNYQSDIRIHSELSWLAALSKDLSIAVQEPAPTVDEKLLLPVKIAGVPEERICSLLRWLPGRFHKKRVLAHHAYSLGKTMALLHDHSQKWRQPKSFERRHWDENGLFGNGGGYDLPAAELWSCVPKASLSVFTKAAQKASIQIKRWKNDKSQYGLLHADLHLGNVLFKRGTALPLDFDDCGFGPWVYDFAVPLADWHELPNFRSLYENLIAGYAAVKEPPHSQLEHVHTFIAARRVSLALWFIDRSKTNPRFIALTKKWLPKLTKEVRSLLNL